MYFAVDQIAPMHLGLYISVRCISAWSILIWWISDCKMLVLRISDYSLLVRCFRVGQCKWSSVFRPVSNTPIWRSLSTECLTSRPAILHSKCVINTYQIEVRSDFNNCAVINTDCIVFWRFTKPSNQVVTSNPTRCTCTYSKKVQCRTTSKIPRNHCSYILLSVSKKTTVRTKVELIKMFTRTDPKKGSGLTAHCLIYRTRTR